MNTAVVVAGFGWRQGATPGSLRAALALAQAEAAAGTTARPGPLAVLATAQDKAHEACLQVLAAQLGLPVCAVPRARLQAMATTTRSATVQRLRGSGSVAEAAALAAADDAAGQMPAAPRPPRSRLLQPRAVSPDRLATCALATFDPLPPTLP